jgi:hypothetical protein
MSPQPSPNLVFLGRIVVVLVFAGMVFSLLWTGRIDAATGMSVLTGVVFGAALQAIGSLPTAHTPHVDVPEVPPDTSGTATTTWRAAEKP